MHKNQGQDDCKTYIKGKEGKGATGHKSKGKYEGKKPFNKDNKKKTMAPKTPKDYRTSKPHFKLVILDYIIRPILCESNLDIYAGGRFKDKLEYST